MSSSKTAPIAEIGCFNAIDGSRTLVMWTQEQDDLLKEMAEKGRSAKQIGALLGRTESAIFSRARKLGVQWTRAIRCIECGEIIPGAQRSGRRCESCQKKAAARSLAEYENRNKATHICPTCKKEFVANINRKYCSPACYRQDRAKSWFLKRRLKYDPNSRIDIDIYICGKVKEHRENVDYFEAREIWHDGFLGEGYAAKVFVDGVWLETIPQIKQFFNFGRDTL